MRNIGKSYPRSSLALWCLKVRWEDLDLTCPVQVHIWNGCGPRCTVSPVTVFMSLHSSCYHSSPGFYFLRESGDEMLVGRNCCWAGWQSVMVGVLFDPSAHCAVQSITSLISLLLFFGLDFCSIHPIYSYLHWCSGSAWDLCSHSSFCPLLVAEFGSIGGSAFLTHLGTS